VIKLRIVAKCLGLTQRFLLFFLFYISSLITRFEKSIVSTYQHRRFGVTLPRRPRGRCADVFSPGGTLACPFGPGQARRPSQHYQEILGNTPRVTQTSPVLPSPSNQCVTSAMHERVTMVWANGKWRRN